MAVGGALAEDEGNSITYDNLAKEFDQNPGSGKYSLDGTGPFTVTFTDSGRAYLIDENGKVSEIETGPVEQPEETPELWKQQEQQIVHGIVMLMLHQIRQ